MDAKPPDPHRGSDRKNKKIWAFAGGKGGVGRSFLAANFAVQLARRGKSVTLMDLDLDGPTLHAFLGQPSRDPGLSLLWDHGSLPLTDCLQKVPFGEIYFGRGIEGPLGSGEEFLDRLINGIRTLGTEFIILDLGSSRSRFTLQMFRAADTGIVVVTPDHLTLQGTYVFFSQFQNGSQPPAISSGPSPEPPQERQITVPPSTPPPRLAILVNQARTEEDTFLGKALRSGLWKIHGIPSHLLGSVPLDPVVSQACERGRPLSLQYPNSPAASAIGSLLGDLESFPSPTGWMRKKFNGGPPSQDYYEILETGRGTSHRQIQVAYESLKRIYRSGSPFLPATVQPDRIQKITEQIEQAYRTLIFLETRRAYDRRLFAADSRDHPTGADGGKPAPTAAPADAGRDAEETAGEGFSVPGEEFSGAFLRRIRQDQKVSLESISETTKVRKLHLECIEKEDFSCLPPPVFLKGFLRAYAQCLALDPDGVCRDYMNRYQQWDVSRKGCSPPRPEEEL